MHAIVVLLPLAALLLVLTAAWSTARHRFAGLNAALSLLVVALVPVTTSAGEWLEHRVTETALLRDHTELGDTAIWAAIPVALLALVIWWRQREATPADEASAGGSGVTTLTRRRTYLAPLSRSVTRIVVILAVVIAGWAVYDSYRIGDSGAKQFGPAASAPHPRTAGPTATERPST